ncbi:MAG: ATP-dependent Clp protease ATP-binding subunit [Betaproteobacteria bacterium]|nr:ATP-dependent Clp protease ATP-binding subunit [Betaproteobacteria bacterium]
MLARFQTECPGLYSSALTEAKRLEHEHVGVEHVALVSLSDPVSPLAVALKRIGFDAATLMSAFDTEVGTGTSHSATADATPRLTAILTLAAAEGELTPRVLLRSMLLEGESLFARFLVAQGVAIQKLVSVLDGPGPSETSADATRLAGRSAATANAALATPALPRAPSPPPLGAGAKIQPKTAIPVTFPTPTLDEWGRDLRNLAEQGRLADAIGREREIDQMITVLARTQKSNPILLGEAGVGKTAIVEALAWRIAQGVVPPIIRGKRIVELQMGSLMSGTTLRGQFEERISQIVREASQARDVILFIDEIHTIVGAGGGGGALDAAQIMKPALARGEIDCIGATTQDEYNRFIRKDAALERRFSPVQISELSDEATLRVLQGVALRISAKHAESGAPVEFEAEALKAAVDLTNRYVKDRQQPDKAIDAIDIAAARASIAGRNWVTAEDIAAVVAEWTGIQMQRLTEDDRERFARMDQFLAERIIGQDAAVKALSQRVRAAMAGVKAANRPVGVFLFLGPSGVGKTSLAKELARFLFDSPDALLRFDMNEYHEAHTVANLIGSPVGYRDSDQGGALTEGLRRHPYSVVLLDEIEKAHPDVMNVFLGVFDEGRITDNKGRPIDCSNALFIMTSNLGAGEVDFRTAETDELRALAERFMRRELVNRISGVIGFRPLKSEHLAKILDQILTEKARMFATEKGLTIEVDQLARRLLLERGYSPDPGARPLDRAVDEWVVQPLVDAWFANRVKAGRVRFTVAAPAQSSPGALPGNVTVLGGARGSAGARGASSNAPAITFSQE